MDACERFREMAWAQAGELDDGEQAALAAHQATCAGCRAEADGVGNLRDALAPAAGEAGPDEGVLARVHRRLAATRETAAPLADVLTPEELAELLQVPVDEVYENLDLLPAFEFAGRVRFRRRAVEQWIEEQEQRWRQQSQATRRMG